MQGVVHVIDSVLEAPADALERPAVYLALQDFGAKGSMTPARRLGPQCRRDGIPRVRLQLLVGEKAYREQALEAGKGTAALQVPSCPQAAPLYRRASQHVISNEIAQPEPWSQACLQLSVGNICQSCKGGFASLDEVSKES